MKNADTLLYMVFCKNHIVSIPLRGIGYEKLAIAKSVPQNSEMFPSPCGELVMKNLTHLQDPYGLSR
jgi:hypothetical protein